MVVSIVVHALSLFLGVYKWLYNTTVPVRLTLRPRGIRHKGMGSLGGGALELKLNKGIGGTKLKKRWSSAIHIQEQGVLLTILVTTSKMLVSRLRDSTSNLCKFISGLKAPEF